MEKLRRIKETLSEQTFKFIYDAKEAEVSLTTLVNDEEVGNSLIDSISDFYNVMASLKQLVEPQRTEDQGFESVLEYIEQYRRVLYFIKCYYSELEDCLKLIEEKKENYSGGSFYSYFEQSEFRSLTSFEYYEYGSREIYIDYGEAGFGRRYKDVKSENSDEFENISNILSHLVREIEHQKNEQYKLFLLVILLRILINEDEHRIRIDYESINEIIDELTNEELLARLTKRFQELLSRTPVEYKLNFLSNEECKWFGEKIKKDDFTKKISDLSKGKQNLLSCLAVAESKDGGWKYYSINRLDDPKMDIVHETLQNLLGDEYVPAKITDDVRYLFNDKDYITYKDFQNQSPNPKYNRMFTCCERKIFAKIRTEKQENESFFLIVSKDPCIHCNRELYYLRGEGKCDIEVVSPNEKFDRKAREIYGEVKI